MFTIDSATSASLRSESVSPPPGALEPGERLRQLVTLLADLWRHTQTRDELLSCFLIDVALLRAYPELGQEFLDSFAWVDAQLAAG